MYYDLGYVSSLEVIECSASDLIGQYLGQTGPKTRAQLDKALGKILFVDEAYRLAEGNFATEAINELVDQLTKPKYMDKMIVVLAGYAGEINKLLSTNPGLSSRFSEEIIFHNMSPVQCLEILERTVQKRSIQTPTLTDPGSKIHGQLVDLIEEMSKLPSWGNARDMKTLAKTFVGFVFATEATSPNALTISEEDVLRLTKVMLKERQDRHTNLPTNLPIRTHQQAAEQSHEPPPLPPVVESSSTQTKAPPNKHKAPPNKHKAPPNKHKAPPNKQKAPPKPASPQEPGVENDTSAPEAHLPTVQRDAGVSDETWAQLQADIIAAAAEPKISEQALWEMHDAVSTTWEDEHQADLALKRLEDSKAKEKQEEADARRLEQALKEARAEQERARKEQERAKAEFEKMRMQRAQQKREKAVQEKLRNLGVCRQGYQWLKQADGYRCAGGSHFMTNSQLGM